MKTMAPVFQTHIIWIVQSSIEDNKMFLKDKKCSDC